MNLPTVKLSRPINVAGVTKTELVAVKEPTARVLRRAKGLEPGELAAALACDMFNLTDAEFDSMALADAMQVVAVTAPFLSAS